MGTATTVLTSAQWNAIIDQVNSATASCGGGKLQHVTDLHLWSYTDVMAVQSALKAACSTNTFTTPVGPPYLWLQKIIDEINTARVKGCCNMPPPSYCSQSTISVVSFNPPGTPAYNPKGAPNGATIATMVVQATGTTSAQSVQNLQPVENAAEQAWMTQNPGVLVNFLQSIQGCPPCCLLYSWTVWVNHWTGQLWASLGSFGGVAGSLAAANAQMLAGMASVQASEAAKGVAALQFLPPIILCQIQC